MNRPRENKTKECLLRGVLCGFPRGITSSAINPQINQTSHVRLPIRAVTFTCDHLCMRTLPVYDNYTLLSILDFFFRHNCMEFMKLCDRFNFFLCCAVSHAIFNRTLYLRHKKYLTIWHEWRNKKAGEDQIKFDSLLSNFYIFQLLVEKRKLQMAGCRKLEGLNVSLQRMTNSFTANGCSNNTKIIRKKERKIINN